MRRIFAVSVVVFFAACSDSPTTEVTRSVSDNSPSLSVDPIRKVRQPNAEEIELRKQLKAVLPPGSEAVIAHLDDFDSRVISKNPRVQELLDRIYASRRMAPPSEPAVIEVTLAQVDRFQKAGVTARILRRADGETPNIIVLSADANAGALATAMKILSFDIRRSGIVSTKNHVLEVYGDKVPKHWDADLINSAEGDLAELSNSTRQVVKGVGRVRSKTVLISAPPASLQR